MRSGVTGGEAEDGEAHVAHQHVIQVVCADEGLLGGIFAPKAQGAQPADVCDEDTVLLEADDAGQRTLPRNTSRAGSRRL